MPMTTSSKTLHIVRIREVILVFFREKEKKKIERNKPLTDSPHRAWFWPYFVVDL